MDMCIHTHIYICVYTHDRITFEIVQSTQQMFSCSRRSSRVFVRMFILSSSSSVHYHHTGPPPPPLL